MRARVTDRAGNEGDSAVESVQVTSAPGWVLSAQVLTADPLDGLAREQLGDVRLSLPLDLDLSPGTAQGGSRALVYNSDSIAQTPLVQGTIQTPTSGTLPANINAVLTINGTATATLTYSTTGLDPGDSLALTAQATSAVSTGRYAWTLHAGATGYFDQTVSGIAYVVAQDASPFGAGWTFSPTDRLYDIPADGNGPHVKLRAWGSGEWRTYTDAGGGSYTSMPSDNGTLSFSGTTSTYSTPDGQTWTFNSSGYQTGWASADGQWLLTFTYSGSIISTETAIDGTQTTFNYSGSLVSSIVTGNGRHTTLAYDASNNLTQVTAPDGGLHTFSYDSVAHPHHLIGETAAEAGGGVDLQDEWAYGTSGALATFTWGSAISPSVTAVSPAAVQGLAAAVRSPVSATVTDPLLRPTAWQLDARGRLGQRPAADGGPTTRCGRCRRWSSARTPAARRSTTRRGPSSASCATCATGWPAAAWKGWSTPHGATDGIAWRAHTQVGLRSMPYVGPAPQADTPATDSDCIARAHTENIAAGPVPRPDPRPEFVGELCQVEGATPPPPPLAPGWHPAGTVGTQLAPRGTQRR
jgi:YD repeat-containing protein